MVVSEMHEIHPSHRGLVDLSSWNAQSEFTLASIRELWVPVLRCPKMFCTLQKRKNEFRLLQKSKILNGRDTYLKKVVSVVYLYKIWLNFWFIMEVGRRLIACLVTTVKQWTIPHNSKMEPLYRLASLAPLPYLTSSAEHSFFRRGQKKNPEPEFQPIKRTRRTKFFQLSYSPCNKRHFD